ncbi:MULTISPECIES: hypothetical protein [unclassified Sinorhizobium]|uniref:hypothetical protein n=1 Tax=unclassified Sinorhizobium TaxID=2613772 RepID=UPI0024C2890F|nr:MULTISPECIES: hypothetical protein [unclassified Sinorhizobium]MDK1378410.1 hypothetical protein [Sinorhizobium sp. 6-70]MDK1482431.1 hypothetical protein [Sinorhizobium sp. 6-117]
MGDGGCARKPHGARSRVYAADVLPALAPQPQPEESPEGWSFSFAPYFWIAGIDGDTASFGSPTVEIDQSFSDIFSDLDFGFMAAGDARYGRFSIFTDLQYAKVSTDSATPRGILANKVDVKTATFSGLLGAGYAVVDDSSARLDVIGGVKVWSAETEISFRGGILDGVSWEDKETWVDGLVGLRGLYSFTPEWYVTGWGLVAAGEADLDWDLIGAIGYNINDRISALAGYRAMGVDYSNDGFTYDVIQHGPIIGVAIRF